MHAVSRRLLKFALLAGVATGLWQAGAQARTVSGFEGFKAAVEQTASVHFESLPPLPPVLVWTGADVDGDGQADFANPTGEAPRVHDAYGSGQFGASRDGGSRQHAGVDYQGEAGLAVHAPMSGYVTKIGYAYEDADLRYVEISNPALRYVARVLYVDPSVSVGQAVRLGDRVGSVASLQGRYPGITNHVHLEVARTGGPRMDATKLITAHLETPTEAG